MDDRKTTLTELKDLVVEFREARNWKQFHKPKDLTLAIGIEVAELAELFLWKDDSDTARDMEREDFRKRLRDEMADVQILLLSLAAVTGVDIAAAVGNKIAQNAEKYPVDKAYGSAAKYTELQ